MIRPGLALALWLALAIALVANHAIGDTMIAGAIGPVGALWYKTLLPIPYAAMLALIHARHTRGPQALAAGWIAGGLWAPSTAMLDMLYGRLTFGELPQTALDRYSVLDGSPWALLPLALLLLPPSFAWLSRHG